MAFHEQKKPHGNKEKKKKTDWENLRCTPFLEKEMRIVQLQVVCSTHDCYLS